MNSFENKVALVTAAGSGIGRPCALAFAVEGAKVFVADIAVADREKTAGMVKAACAVIWLCSDAASFVTGHALMVDGGYIAQ